MNKGKFIVLNRMYVGDYLSANLGHEVINMYTADNGGHYIYLNAYGSFAAKWTNEIGAMLLTKYHDKDCVEVIGKAVGLSDVYDYEKDGNNKGEENIVISEHQKEAVRDISYCGVPLLELFSNVERQAVYVTFEAEKVFRVHKGKEIYIHFVPQKRDEAVHGETQDKVSAIEHYEKRIDIYLSNNKLALASLNQFFTHGDDFAILDNIIKNPEYDAFWMELGDDDKVPADIKGIDERKISLFEICQIQNDENRFSNALAYFMQQPEYSDLWCGFLNNILGKNKDNEIEKIDSITREEVADIKNEKIKKCLIKEERKRLKETLGKRRQELRVDGGRIDLVIRATESLIIVENKIKSEINSVVGDCDGKQLRRYYNYANWLVDLRNGKSTDKGRTLHFLVLCPEYNKPDLAKYEDLHEIKMKDVYKIVTYADLYGYLKEHYEVFKENANFVAFHNAMHRHTHCNINDYLYHDMQDKFYRRILEYNNKGVNRKSLKE